MIFPDHLLPSRFLIPCPLVLLPRNLKEKPNVKARTTLISTPWHHLKLGTSLLEYLQIFLQDCMFLNACFGLLALPSSL